MPGWSHEIANEFLRCAWRHGQACDQMQLQKLVYIAHGWCLAFSGEPLTGDRPEAWEFGPSYRRLADAVAQHGTRAVTTLIYADVSVLNRSDASPVKSDLSQFEMDTIAMVYTDYGALSAARLASLTQGPGTPWRLVYDGGAGTWRDIPHWMIREQFAKYATEAEH